MNNHNDARRRNQTWRPVPTTSVNNTTQAAAQSNGKRAQPSVLLQLWTDIERTLGMHGVRRVKPKRRSIFASIAWLLILVLACLMFGFAITQRIAKYLEYGTQWSVRTTGVVHEIGWPAISICNLSPVRLSQFTKLYWPLKQHENASWSTFLEHNSTLSSRIFFTSTAQQKHDMLIRCRVQGSDCYFLNSLTLTSDGVCYTIKPESNSEFVELWLNAEVYDALPLSDNGLGFKVYIHGRDGTPLDTDHFFYVTPGHTYDVMIYKEGLSQLPAPYGLCVESPDPIHDQSCHAHCIFQHIEKTCGCTPHWTSTHGLQVCDIGSHFDCVLPEFKGKTKSIQSTFTNHYCLCYQACYQEYFKTQVTSAMLSPGEYSQYLDQSEIPHYTKKYKSVINAEKALNHDTTDFYLIHRLNSSYLNLVSTVDNLMESITLLKDNIKREYVSLVPRIRFHSNIALEGMHEVLVKKFSLAWKKLEENHLQSLTYTTFEALLLYNRTIQMLKTSTDNAVRRYLYTRMDDELEVKMASAEIILDNVTTIFMHYLQSKPIIDEDITPYGRYDDALIPREILTSNNPTQVQYYNLLSQEIGEYIQQIAEMQGILKGVYKNSRTNETNFEMSKTNFTVKSSRVNTLAALFHKHIITAPEKEIENIQADFAASVQAMNITHKHVTNHVAMLEQYLGYVNATKMANLKEVLSHITSYFNPGNLTQEHLIDLVVAKDTTVLFDSLQEISVETILHLTQIILNVGQFTGNLINIWEHLLTEESLNSFYFRLNNDVMEMKRDSSRTTFFLDIFADQKMLNLTEEDINTLILKDLTGLLNADVPQLDIDQKRQYISITMQDIIDRTNYKALLFQAIQMIHRDFEHLKTYLTELNETVQLGHDFYRNNMIKVRLQHRPAYYTHWMQIVAYTLDSLLLEVGMLMAVFLGASVLSCLELIDIMVTWLLNRSCCQGYKSKKTESNHSAEEMLIKPYTDANKTFDPNKSFDGDKSLDTLSNSRQRVTRTPSYTSDSLQSRDVYRDNYHKRPNVTFQDSRDSNNIRGSEV